MRRVLATHRIQLTPSAGFDRAAQAVPLLADLGVSHVYVSPVLRAVPGSRHGYDVVDPHHVDLERGGEHGFASFVDTAHAHGLGVLLDVVPNHLSGDPHGPAWSDVLRLGRASRFAAWFDLAWSSGNEQVADRILLPMLGSTLAEAIAGGHVRLARCGTDVVLRVHDQQLPVSDISLADLAGSVAERLRGDVGAPAPVHVPAGRTGTGAHDPSARVRALADELRAHADRCDAEGCRRAGSVLGALAADDASVGAALDKVLGEVSRDATSMTRLLAWQHYELAHWREGTRRLDRRRFFDVAELVGVRQEDPEVFAATHGRVLAMVRGGAVDGLRIDHPDGLSDPTGYLTRLRAEIGDTWLVVEKILSDGEELPAVWPVDGTVGYEHAALLDRLFVDPRGERPLTEVVRRHCPRADGVATDDVDAVVERAERDALSMLFEPELRRLAALAVDECADLLTDGRPDTLDESAARSAVEEMVVACPVYRTYVRPGETAGATDAQVLDQLAADAVNRLRGTGATPGRCGAPAAAVVARLRALFDRADRSAAGEEFVARFQQLTSAVTAKGVEDTAFYRLPRLVSLCEVGADPRRWSVSPQEFHAHRARELAHHPLGLVATSTHDSKRSIDARCRLAALSEVPELWSATADRVMARLDELVGGPHRDRLLDLLLLQYAVAVHPVSTERLVAAAWKAAREAKHLTNWHEQHAGHEAVVVRVVRAVVEDPVCRDAMRPLLTAVVPAGRRASLAAHLLVFAGPGVPDLYQGSLGWNLSLADPDNRDDVDLALEEQLLAEARRDGARWWDAAAIAGDERGVSKAHVIATCLEARHVHAAALGAGATYAPLRVSGGATDHVVAHAAGDADRQRLVVVASRWYTTLERTGGWADTEVELPAGRWTDVLRGDGREVSGTVGLTDLLGDLPGALLVAG